MSLIRFTAYTAIGSAAYNTALIAAGYLLGDQWQSINHYSRYINYTIIAGLVLTVAALAVRRSRHRHAARRQRR